MHVQYYYNFNTLCEPCNQPWNYTFTGASCQCSSFTFSPFSYNRKLILHHSWLSFSLRMFPFQLQQAEKGPHEPVALFLPSTRQQIDRVSWWQVNTVEHSADDKRENKRKSACWMFCQIESDSWRERIVTVLYMLHVLLGNQPLM